jgi:hypothetical protein
MTACAEPDRSPQRIALIQKISAKLQGEKVRRVFWSLLQYGDLDQLEQQFGDAKENNIFTSSETVAVLAKLWRGMYREKKRKHKCEGEDEDQDQDQDQRGEVSSKEKALSRNSKTAALAKKRENWSCLITGVSYIHAVHIYPFHLLYQSSSSNKLSTFWKLLKMFYNNEEIEAVEKQLFPESRSAGEESVRNMICLNPLLHIMWTYSEFGLYPYPPNEEGTEMKLEWVWLPKYHKLPDELIDINEVPDVTKVLAIERPPIWTNVPFGRGGEKQFRPILSGEYFLLQTEDPKELPLPSYEILLLQWRLQRMLALAGAAEEDDEDDDRLSETDSELLCHMEADEE